MTRRFIDEVEVEAHRRPGVSQADLGDLFAPIEPPRRPPVERTEQRALLIPGGTLEGDYAAWRETELGRFVYEAIRTKAIGEARTGARRLSAKALMEWCRATHRVECNNTWTALIGRELAEREPELRPLFEFRQRSAA